MTQLSLLELILAPAQPPTTIQVAAVHVDGNAAWRMLDGPLSTCPRCWLRGPHECVVDVRTVASARFAAVEYE